MAPALFTHFLGLVIIPQGIVCHFSYWHLSDNHLRNPLTTQCLASNKLLALQARQSIEERGEKEKNSCCDQARRTGDKTDPLQSTHNGVHGGAHPISSEPPNKGVELFGGRAYSEQKGHLDEDENKSGNKANDAEDDADRVKRKDVGNAEGDAEDNAHHSRPLSVDTEVSRAEFLSERHDQRWRNERACDDKPSVSLSSL